MPVSDLCRKHGVSDASIYKWKARFGGMDVSEAERLRALEDKNAKLKRMLADTMLDNVALNQPGKKWWRPLPSAELSPTSWNDPDDLALLGCGIPHSSSPQSAIMLF